MDRVFDRAGYSARELQVDDSETRPILIVVTGESSLAAENRLYCVQAG